MLTGEISRVEGDKREKHRGPPPKEWAPNSFSKMEGASTRNVAITCGSYRQVIGVSEVRDAEHDLHLKSNQCESARKTH